jgi:predicted transcriptional regulator
MSHALTIRLPDDLAKWIEKLARTRKTSRSEIVREQLSKAREATSEKPAGEEKPWMKLAGKGSGPPDLSSRKGFYRP